mgnify:CR=1 FL=1
MVERIGKGQHAIATDTTPGRLEPDHATGRGWKANRATRVTTQCAIGQPRCCGNPRAAGRRAGRYGFVPRIARNLQLGMIAAHGTFSQIELAEQHRPRFLQPIDDRGVIIGYEVGQDRGTAHGTHTFGEAEILDGDRYAMQRPAMVT